MTLVDGQPGNVTTYVPKVCDADAPEGKTNETFVQCTLPLLHHCKRLVISLYLCALVRETTEILFS